MFLIAMTHSKESDWIHWDVFVPLILLDQFYHHPWVDRNLPGPLPLIRDLYQRLPC
jgi:hypothetical protein